MIMISSGAKTSQVIEVGPDLIKQRPVWPRRREVGSPFSSPDIYIFAAASIFPASLRTARLDVGEI
jgi:hypothetical protein